MKNLAQKTTEEKANEIGKNIFKNDFKRVRTNSECSIICFFIDYSVDFKSLKTLEKYYSVRNVYVDAANPDNVIIHCEI